MLNEENLEELKVEQVEEKLGCKLKAKQIISPNTTKVYQLMMVIKLATTTTCFGPSNGHHQVVHLASTVYTICKQTLLDDEISIILIYSKPYKLIQMCIIHYTRSMLYISVRGVYWVGLPRSHSFECKAGWQIKLSTMCNKNEEQGSKNKAELQTKWTKTTWKTFEEPNRRVRNRSVQASLVTDDDDDVDDDAVNASI